MVQQCHHLYLQTSVFRSSNQSRSQIYGRQGTFCPLWLHNLCTSYSRNTYITVCHRAEWWEMGSYYNAKSWNWSKLTAIYHPCLSLEVRSLQTRVSKYLYKILPVQFCLGGDTDFCYFLLYRLPRILKPRFNV